MDFLGRFKDREEAAKLLSEKLIPFKKDNPIVLAIPRGAVPIAAIIAEDLEAPMDLVLIKKIGAIHNPELAIGAISEDGHTFFNKELVQILGISADAQKRLAQAKLVELKKQKESLLGDRASFDIRDRTVIIVDDGIATGATLISSIEFLRHKNPKKIIVASPVGAKETIKKIEKIADEVIVLMSPVDFIAVGLWYETFDQVTDKEVRELLKPQKLSLSTSKKSVQIPFQKEFLKGDLHIPKDMKGIILFAHGSGSSRLSPRNRYVADCLNQENFGTLLLDLLTEDEALERSQVFDIPKLAERLQAATKWIQDQYKNIPLGYFGASTGAGAALVAATKPNLMIKAIVSRGGRPDLAGDYLPKVKSPTLLIVGGADDIVITLNMQAQKRLRNCELVIVPDATHLFEEEGALDQVVDHAIKWFKNYLERGSSKSEDTLTKSISNKSSDDLNRL
ncbi:phosphoribosyltransferase family protein [Bdellovibrio bacteriovorus]